MTEPINQSINRNTTKQCKASGCYNPRRNLGGYCKQHYRKVYLYGNPYGRAILSKDCLRETQEVNELIDSNLEHPAVVAACTYLQRWLDMARKGVPCICGNEVARVASEATAIDILKATSTIWLYAERNPNKVNSDDYLTYLLGISFLKCAKYRVKLSPLGKPYNPIPSGRVRKVIGQRLRETL
ncbi:MAG: hypothetical protein EWV86_08230, partial [Microcystis panniformis Mp_MB_F_20051200_S9D]